MLTLANKLTLSTQPTYRFVNKYSIDFDGVDDCIVTDGADTVLQNTTYSMWIKSSKTSRNAIFGHGNSNYSTFNLNETNRPLLWLGGGYYRYWNDTSAQDDGEWHHWVVYQDINDITNCKLYCDGVLQGVYTSSSSTTPAAYTESLTIGATKNPVNAGGYFFQGNIDEFAVYDRELTQAEITRMYNTYYSPNRVANGNFSQIGNEEITNGDFSEVGSELVTNGDFSSGSTGWENAFGGEWVINSGKATLSIGADGSYLRTVSNILTSGKLYKAVITTSGGLDANNIVTIYASSSTGQSIESDGTHTKYFTADGTSFRFLGVANDKPISIDNVSVKEVGQDWTFGTGWSTDGTKAIADSSSDGNFLYSAQALVIGKTYKVSFSAIVSSGTVRVYSGGFPGLEVSSTSSFTGSFVAAATQFGFYSSGFDGSIDNISIKEVGQHWTFGTGWSVEDNQLVSVSGTAAYTTQSGVGVIGRTYRVIADVEEVSAGQTYLYTGQYGTFYTIDSAGIYTFSVVWDTFSQLGIYKTSTFAGKYNSIVVQELKHDATNLMLNAGAYQSANPLITSTKSMEFDGIDDYLIVNEGYDYDNRTFATWFNSADNTKTGADSNTILSQTASSGGNRWHLRIDDTDNQVKIYDGGTIILSGNINTTTIEENRWYNVVMTEDGTTLKFYINGIIQGSGSVTLVSASDDVLTFGQEFDSTTPSDFFKGEMTEAGVWDRVLTALEIASLYNQGMPTNLLVNRNDYQSGNPTVFNTKQVDFDGTDDYMVSNITSSTFTGSVSAWVNRDGNSGYQFIVDFRGEGNTGTGAFYFDTNSDTLAAISGTLYVDGVAGSTVPTDGNWHHVVVSGMSIVISEPVFFSRYSLSNTLNLNGQMSQIGLWNSTLTADEVSSLYNHGLPIDLTTDQAAYESSSNLVGYWRMGSGTLDSYPLIADQTNATLGSEEVVNGSFTGVANGTDVTTLTNWNAYGSPTSRNVVDNKLVIVTNSFNQGAYYDLGSLTGTYKLSVDVSGDVGSGGLFIQATSNHLVTTSLGTVEFSFVASGSTIIYFRAKDNNAGTTSYTNISVKKVNGNPAIMTNQTSSDIENGSPYADLVQNGTFDTDSDWTKGSGWTISGGTANSDGVSGASPIYQNIGAATVGISYKIQLDVSNYTSGTLVAAYGGTSATSITSNGSYTFYVQATSTDANTSYLSYNFIGSIDNVTVEEVNTGLQGYWKMGDGTNDEYPVIFDQTNPTLGSELVTNGNFATDLSGWTNANNHWQWTSQGAYFPETTTHNPLAQILSNNANVILKLTFTLNVVKGTANVFYLDASSGTVSTQYTTSGTYTLYTVPVKVNTSINFSRYGGINTEFYVDNVSVKQVQGNPATMTNMVEGNITNQYPLTKIRNYYRMGDGILDGYPIIQDQTSPNLAHIPTTNLIPFSEDFNGSVGSFSYSKVGGTTVTPNSIIAPDGTNTGTLVTKGTNDLVIRANSVVETNKTYIFSCYVKSSGSGITNISIDITDDNLTSFTLTNDWQRISVTAEVTRTPQSTFNFVDMAANGSQNDTFYTWGWQIEEQNQSTAYIKSDGIAAVRKSSTTNLITYSEDFNNAIWSKVAAGTGIAPIVTSDYSLSPIGTQTADRIQFNLNSGTSSSDTSYITTGLSLGTINATLSIYLKTNDSTTKDITLRLGAGLFDYDVTVTSEWQRFSLSGNTNVDRIQLLLYGNQNSQTADLSVWGVQVEQQTQAETYAPTFGLPVTIDLFTENNYGTMTNMSSSDIIEDTPNN